MNPVEIFQTDGQVSLKVSLDADTVWLSQAQMVELFERNQSTIARHIRKALNEGEINAKSNMQKMHIANSDKPVTFYDLDVIISVGYKVNSRRGIQFRKWATKVLNQYLVQGYALNEMRLQERNIEFKQAIDLLSATLTNQSLVINDGQSVLNVINDYAHSWSLLQGYDEQSLSDNKTPQAQMLPIDYQEALKAINALKKELMEKGEATTLFGQIRGKGLTSALQTIEQGFGDELFYPNVAS